MLEAAIRDFYKRYRLSKYRSIFALIKERSGSLSATEAFCVDVINLLNRPTIKQFSDFIGISQSNATYKINSLIQKGYINKIISEEDRREYRLVTTDKYHNYFDADDGCTTTAVKLMAEKYSAEELDKFGEMLSEFSKFAVK